MWGNVPDLSQPCAAPYKSRRMPCADGAVGPLLLCLFSVTVAVGGNLLRPDTIGLNLPADFFSKTFERKWALLRARDTVARELFQRIWGLRDVLRHSPQFENQKHTYYIQVAKQVSPVAENVSTSPPVFSQHFIIYTIYINNT